MTTLMLDRPGSAREAREEDTLHPENAPFEDFSTSSFDRSSLDRSSLTDSRVRVQPDHDLEREPSVTSPGADPDPATEPRPDPQAQAYQRMLDVCSSPDWLERRGPFYGVLRQEADFLSPGYSEVFATPALGFMASNYNPSRDDTEHYYVNGMTVGPDDMERHLGYLTRVYGRPVTAIINGQEPALQAPDRPGMLRSIVHAFMGILSPYTGSAVEPRAIDTIERHIMDHVQRGQPMHIVAHSQGSILVGNALENLCGPDSKLPPETRERIRELVQVSTFGAAQHYFPAGVRAQEYSHGGDFVVGITNILTSARETICGIWRAAQSAWRGLFGYESPQADQEAPSERAPVISLSGGHDFGEYLSHMPDYFIERHTRDGAVDGHELAKSLKLSILRGELSDPVHGMIIGRMIERGDHEFARTFVSGSASGWIGEFRIPYFEALRDLGERR